MLTITPIPAFNDNYIWLMFDPDSREALVVDPGDAAPVLSALQARNLTLSTILVTHHHGDHTGGIETLTEHYTDSKVIGSQNSQYGGLNQSVSEGDTICCLGRDFTVIEVPGHTLDHIAFFSAAPTPIVFCGDTLFAAGCGRMFEGYPEQMQASLQKLADLPASTAVYCAHEYTLNNLKFALAVEPHNDQLLQRVEQVNNLRAQQIPSVPSTIAEELATNPFLRVETASVIARVQQQFPTTQNDKVSIFHQLRQWKDTF